MLILVCLLKRVCGFSQAPVCRLCVRLNSFGITGLYVEAQGIGSVIVPILQVYTPNATSEYQTFVDEVNDALLRVSPTESTVLMGDFNVHVGTDTDTWKGVIGKHGVTELNENGRYLLQLRCTNGLRIMNTFFQHREVHKQGWQYGTVRSEFAYYVPRTLNRTSVSHFSSIFEAYRTDVPYQYHHKKGVPYQCTVLLSKN